VSEQEAAQIQAETGSVVAGPAAPEASAAGVPVAASAHAAEVKPPELAASQAGKTPRAGEPAEAPSPDAPKMQPPKLDAAGSSEKPGLAGKVMIMAPRDRVFDGEDAADKAGKPALSARRRFAAIAAVVVLAVAAGAAGGALATAGVGYYAHASTATATVAPNDVAIEKDAAIQSSIARIESEILALKAGLEHTSKLGMSQFNKTSDRLEKLEKAQAEPAAKLAKLSEAVERLKANAPAAIAAAGPAGAKDITGTVTPPATTAAAPAAPSGKPDVGRLPTVEGWVLRDVSNGGALIESRRGLFEVYAGDPIPGLGRIDAIRKQDGHWVVVTSRGLIVAR
jgi:hypothetical protein